VAVYRHRHYLRLEDCRGRAPEKPNRVVDLFEYFRVTARVPNPRQLPGSAFPAIRSHFKNCACGPPGRYVDTRPAQFEPHRFDPGNAACNSINQQIAEVIGGS
jgi:hypothetical protein